MYAVQRIHCYYIFIPFYINRYISHCNIIKNVLVQAVSLISI